MAIKHVTPADGTFSSTGATEWDRDHNLIEGSGATLAVGTIDDGLFLKRDGSTIVGATAAGPSGPQGATGPTGPVGADGATGIAGADGTTGPTGPIGPSGPAGADGATGVAGATGIQGPTGVQGTTGAQGATGTTGADSTVPGPTGPTGPAGATGATGADSTVPGPTGPTGPAGATGVAGATGASAGTGPSFTRATADVATSTTSALANVTALAFSVVSGTTYCFAFNVLFQSNTLTTGLKLGLTFPAATIVSANAVIPIAADGTASMFAGTITSSGDSVTGTAVEATGTNYLAMVDGTIKPSANGTLQLQYASEDTGGVVVKEQSVGMMIPVP